MISRLRGILISKKPAQILLEVYGVGYDIQVPLSTLLELPNIGQEVVLYTEFIVREDSHKLFGFLTEFERELFNKVTKVSGIGPKLGLTILSSLSPDQFIKIIQASDLARLVGLPGVGKKTAERLILELRDKFEGEMIFPSLSDPFRASSDSDHIVDAKAALVALGYSVKEAQQGVSSIDRIELQSLSTEAIIKIVLARLLKVLV